MSLLLSDHVAPSRLLVVSNRIPVTIKEKSRAGEYDFSQGTGGLVSGIRGLFKKTTFQWVGWTGLEVPETHQTALSKRLCEEHSVIPVYLQEAPADLYYNGFANSILWPLLHYHPGEITFREDCWQAYKQVNLAFAQVLAKHIQTGDVIWVHDYHLMLLPQMLRDLIDPSLEVRIGFFLHTPFPSSEIYRILPVRNELLEGLLHSNLIGFHTTDYARHFLSACSNVLKIATTTRSLTFKDQTVNVGAFPIGIEPDSFRETMASNAVQVRLAELEQQFAGKIVLVGVDRLDYVKGIPQKLHALEIFLEQHPEFVGKIVLVQIAVPTRGDVEEYQNLRAVVNELVGRINGRFGTIEETPIHFIHRNVCFHELLALYAVSDVCVVASTRDGMNLVSFEYVACQQKRHGAMILSEFCGSAQSLAGAIIVNPWNEHEMARAFYQAVTMTPAERQERYQAMEAYVNKFTSAFWGTTFVASLAGPEPKSVMHERLWMNPKERSIDWRSYDG